jgi:anti-sigma factor RsiW
MALAAPALAAEPPTVTSVAPSKGPPAGETTVTITGAHFGGATAVKFGSNSASFTVNSETSITAVSPALTPRSSAIVGVTVTTPAGTSQVTQGGGQTFAYEPTVTKLFPSSGSTAGGTDVVIEGRAFAATFLGAPPPCWVCEVKFGSTAASSYEVHSGNPLLEQENYITAVAPPGTGTVDVTVRTGAGTSPLTPADQFTYVQPEAPTVAKVEPINGPASGGTAVTITGTNLTGTTAVRFGSNNATSFTVNSASSITAVAPAGTGTVDVTVTTGGGTSATGEADRFTYGPTVSNLEPNHGSPSGGTTVTITGTGFTGATAVSFGSTSAKSFTVNSATSITAVSPRGKGTVDVAVATPAGTSPTSAADQFTFSRK